ncbi:MAG TPA: hypothetical protein VFK12_02140 [Gammaproteobacteria bacterium]|jgi:hypothetical protein|nr:hypothetical protein [Gammaproteobacteria bacterium]
MPPTRKQPGLAPDDIPLLEDVVEPESAEPATIAETSPSAPAAIPVPEPESESESEIEPAPAEAIPLDILSEVLTERITALTDRLLRDASAEIHATLVNKVWEKLREEIPGLIEAALRENGGDT